MRKSIYIISFCLLFFLTGCVGSTAKTIDEMYEVLENVVTIEQQFDGKELLNLEQQERDIYNEINSLGMDQFDKIKELANEALVIVDKRKEQILAEYESMEKSKVRFADILPLIEKLDSQDNVELKEKATNLYDQMMIRYDHYDKLYNHYIKGLEYDKELYEMFQNEQLTYEELQGQIEKINLEYEQLMNRNEEFNKATEKYNEMKIAFYEASGLLVEKK